MHRLAAVNFQTSPTSCDFTMTIAFGREGAAAGSVSRPLNVTNASSPATTSGAIHRRSQ
jgi:hypothetical protein